MRRRRPFASLVSGEKVGRIDCLEHFAAYFYKDEQILVEAGSLLTCIRIFLYIPHSFLIDRAGGPIG